jgi:hypothetical protein
MTSLIHNVSRGTSALRSEELAESHAYQVLGWQSGTLSHDWEGAEGARKHQVATHRLSRLRHGPPLNRENRRVR